MPVAITSLDQVTTVEKKTASELQIAILTKVDVEELLSLAQKNASPGDSFQYLRSKIPSPL